MKKTFPLQVANKATPRVIDAIKHDVRKYLKRERAKKLPEGVDFWDFACRVGADSTSAAKVHVAELNKAIDDATQPEASEVYIEILAKPGHRAKRD